VEPRRNAVARRRRNSRTLSEILKREVGLASRVAGTLIVAISCVSCGRKEEQQSTGLTAEEYSAFVVGLQNTFPEYSGREMLVLDQREPFGMFDEPLTRIEKALRWLSDAPYRSALRAQGRRDRIDVGRLHGINAGSVSSEWIEDLFSADEPVQDSWNEFYRRYPESGGYFVLGELGMDRKRSVALVSVGQYSGDFACLFRLLRLVRKEKGWEVAGVETEAVC